ncbi:MAG: DNA/RNA-binding protein Alba [Candidatus Bathyarchaeota archaeon BA1]|nr:MAG: DNA/RNA-binding protein Alba [Candidatus Bathyarchaeota archaeon BA1]
MDAASEKKLILLEIRGVGRFRNLFGDYKGKRIFIEDAPKESKYVVAEITSIKGRIGSAKCVGSYQSLEEAKNKLKELQGKPEIVKREEVIKPERPIEKPIENVVFIGAKPVMNYVVACVTLFNVGVKEITMKARGRAIIRAIDAAELLKRAFIKDLEIKTIEIGTEEVTRPEGKRNLSTIEITLRRKG